MSANTCFAITYDGINVYFINEHMERFHFQRVNMYIIEKSRNIDFVYYTDIDQDTGIVYNPPYIIDNSRTDTTHAWFAKKCAAKDCNIVMNDIWRPIYITMAEKDNVGPMDDFNIIVTEDIKSANLLSVSTRDKLIFPLLETIIYVFPEYSGFSLRDICIQINGCSSVEFNDKIVAMKYLFSKYERIFTSLSQVEYCSMADLHKCLFNITFDHKLNSLDIKFEKNTLVKELRNVNAYVKSAIITIDRRMAKTYGNIPWYIPWCNVEKSDVISKVNYITKNFIYTSSDIIFTSAPKISYIHIIFFKELTIDGIRYQHGSSIGLIGSNENPRVEFRGALFENLSSRESTTLTAIYLEFINRTSMSELFDYVNIYENVIFHDGFRKDFILEIQTLLKRLRV